MSGPNCIDYQCVFGGQNPVFPGTRTQVHRKIVLHMVRYLPTTCWIFCLLKYCKSTYLDPLKYVFKRITFIHVSCWKSMCSSAWLYAFDQSWCNLMNMKCAPYLRINEPHTMSHSNFFQQRIMKRVIKVFNYNAFAEWICYKKTSKLFNYLS